MRTAGEGPAPGGIPPALEHDDLDVLTRGARLLQEMNGEEGACRAAADHSHPGTVRERDPGMGRGIHRGLANAYQYPRYWSIS